MSKTAVKISLWVGVLTLSVGITWGVLRGIGQLLAYFQEGADPAAALNIVPNVPPDLHADLQWLPDASDTGREMEPYTRTQIESAYLRAWLQWNLSYLKGEPHGLKTYFVGPALEALNDNIEDAAQDGMTIHQVNTRHRLQLHLYSANGSIVSLTDNAAAVSQVITTQDGEALSYNESTTAYDVIMMLEDGNWRVRHWVRRAEPLPTDSPFSENDTQKRTAQVTVDGRDLLVAGEPYHVAGVNYYPQATPWHAFWPEYDSAIIQQDFALAQSLGLNTVRIFVPFDGAGGATPTAEIRANLADLLAQAERYNLMVIITLFDFYGAYQPLFWASADAHVQALVPEFAEHPAILAWDIKNEPDLDYATHGQMMVDAWLAHLVTQIRQYAPNQLVTIGWATPAAAETHAALVDMVSYHYYAPAAQFGDAHRTLQKTVGAKPVLLQEFGLSTWNSFFFPGGHSQPEQAVHYRDVLDALEQEEGTGYVAWTLYDFTAIPKGVVPNRPWILRTQMHMGLVTTAGEQKLAAQIVSPTADRDNVQYTGLARFFKPFWLTVGAFAIGVLLLWMRYGRKRKQSTLNPTHLTK